VRRGWGNRGNPSAAELYINGQPMRLGRWPNGNAFVTVASRVSDTAFTYSGTRPARWSAAEDVWFQGLWYYYWADSGLKAVSIDTAGKTVTLSDSPNYGIRAGQPFFAYNLLEEIDEANEYYINRASDILYLWPPTNGLANADIMLSVLSNAVVDVQGAANIVFFDLEICGSRSTAITLSGCTNVKISHSVIRNCGLHAVTVNDCISSGADHKDADLILDNLGVKTLK